MKTLIISTIIFCSLTAANSYALDFLPELALANSDTTKPVSESTPSGIPAQGRQKNRRVEMSIVFN